MTGPMISVILFGIAALGGMALAAMRLKEKELPMPIALAHGAVAATALVILLVAVTGGGMTGLATASLVIFVIAALGGFYLFSFHLRKKPIPIPVMFVHGLAAVAAYVLLLLSVFGGK